MKKVVLNFADENGNYRKGQERLKKSLYDNGYDGDFIGYTDVDQIGSPTHADNPYAFKTYAISKAFADGYDLVLYIDASIVAVKNPQRIFNLIEAHGWFFQNAGHSIGAWTNDKALEYFNLSREDAFLKPLFSAGFQGLSRHNKTAIKYFNRWRASADAGVFNGSWDNHRHDMSCASIIANDLDMFMHDDNAFLKYASLSEKVEDNIIFKAIGI